jgi:hypothetical protein
MATIVITLKDEVQDGVAGVDMRIENDSPAKKDDPSSLTEAHRLLALIMHAVHRHYESAGPELFLDAEGNPLKE